MNHTHLASLVALAQTGSVAGAAILLSYSTSAVSAHIKQLERRLGATLGGAPARDVRSRGPV